MNTLTPTGVTNNHYFSFQYQHIFFRRKVMRSKETSISQHVSSSSSMRKIYSKQYKEFIILIIGVKSH